MHFHGKKPEKLLFRHSGESRIGSGTGAGIQFIHRLTKHLDSVTLSRRKPGTGVTIFYETVNSSI